MASGLVCSEGQVEGHLRRRLALLPAFQVGLPPLEPVLPGPAVVLITGGNLFSIYSATYLQYWLPEDALSPLVVASTILA
jgi:hypothetical protein